MIKEYNEFKQNRLFQEIISTKTFQNLQKKSFIGLREYLEYKNNRFYLKEPKFNRFDHSINVAVLALYYGKKLDFDEKSLNELIVASLLHDIGHFAFSHSLEDGFRRKFNISHKSNSINIILNDKEINKVLKNHQIDLDKIIFLIEEDRSKEDNIYYDILHGPLNADLIEGDFRTYYYFYDKKLKFNSINIVDAALNNDLEVIDKFWSFKNRVYNTLVNNSLHKVLSYLATKFVLEHVDEEDINLNDFDFDKKYKILDYIIQELSLINFKKREFLVNKEYIVDDLFDDDEFYKRYKISKTFDVLYSDKDEIDIF